MRFDKTEITLKDGRTAVLCPTAPAYSAVLIEYLKVTAAQTQFLLSYPEEIDYTLEAEAALLTKTLDDEKTVMLMALVDGRIAGNCALHPVGGRRRIAHRCSLAIALLREYWNLGLGTAMMTRLEELARQAGYEQIELGFVDGNERGLALYKKMGYVETGRNARAFKYDDGTYRDERLMIKVL